MNSNGEGPISAEWMIPKALWIFENEPETWRKAKFICEKQDYLNYKLTGRMCSSGCNAAARWHWDASLATSKSLTADTPYPGRPVSLLKAINLEELLDKWPQECVAMGEKVGELSIQGQGQRILSLFKNTT